MSEEENSGERNSGWERVRNRRERRERTKARQREGTCLSIAGNRKGYQQSYMRENWRDHKDVTSFYFTWFPDDATEEDLW